MNPGKMYDVFCGQIKAFTDPDMTNSRNNTGPQRWGREAVERI